MIVSLSSLLLALATFATPHTPTPAYHNSTAPVPSKPPAPALAARIVETRLLQVFSTPDFGGIIRDVWIQFNTCANLAPDAVVASIKFPLSFYKNEMTCVFYNVYDCPDGRPGLQGFSSTVSVRDVPAKFPYAVRGIKCNQNLALQEAFTDGPIQTP